MLTKIRPMIQRFSFLIACAMCVSARADTAIDINSANDLVREGKFDEAVDRYHSVVPGNDVKDDLNYNLAVAQYRTGDIEAAKRLFTDVASSPKSALATASRYNLGNCFYYDAVAALPSDKAAAIKSLQHAIDLYRSALALDANHTDARANIELAAELIKKLRAAQKQEQSQQQDPQQERQPKDSSDQNSKSPENDQQQDSKQPDSDNSEKDSKQDSESSTNPTSSQDPPDQQRQEQSQQDASDKQSSQGQSDKPDDSADQSTTSEPSEPSLSPKKNDESSQAFQQTDQTQDQPPSQQADPAVPRGDLKAAHGQDANPTPTDRFGIADPNADDRLMSKEEALKMLQAVRDRDMLRRLRQQQIERNMRVPTDRDW